MRNDTAPNAKMSYALACQHVLRYVRAIDPAYGQGAYISDSEDRGTHWLLTYALRSLEDPSRTFMWVTVAVEKNTGDVYRSPSRVPRPIDWTDMVSIRQSCTPITPSELDQMKSKEPKG